MRLLLMGAPGAGKGTQAVFIKNAYNIPHISTGDMFRSAIKNATPLGIMAKSYIDKGLLVPDSVTIGLVKERLSEADCRGGFILDGFPRNLFQAEELDKILAELGVKLDACLNIDVDQKVLTDRIVGRRVCPKCGASFHIENLKPQVEGICDYCGAELIQRKDDTLETVTPRLEVYNTSTAPLLDYYKKQGILKCVDGEGEVEQIFANILKALGEKND